MNVTLLYSDGCPHWPTTAGHLRMLAAERPDHRITHRPVTTPDEADAVRFQGSPSVLVEGVDPFADPDAPAGLACRVYRTPDGPAGSPTLAQLRDALRNE